MTPLREAMNVAEELERDALIRRKVLLRRDALLDKHTIERWNRRNPTEVPFSTAFEDAVIAWCDGKGPMPNAEDFGP